MEEIIKCDNCELEGLGYQGLCPACFYLAHYGIFENKVVADRARLERLTNRRWQMRFNRGEIE